MEVAKVKDWDGEISRLKVLLKGYRKELRELGVDEEFTLKTLQELSQRTKILASKSIGNGI